MHPLQRPLPPQTFGWPCALPDCNPVCCCNDWALVIKPAANVVDGQSWPAVVMFATATAASTAPNSRVCRHSEQHGCQQRRQQQLLSKRCRPPCFQLSLPITTAPSAHTRSTAASLGVQIITTERAVGGSIIHDSSPNRPAPCCPSRTSYELLVMRRTCLLVCLSSVAFLPQCCCCLSSQSACAAPHAKTKSVTIPMCPLLSHIRLPGHSNSANVSTLH
mmetsp:Transcript_13530/g.39179  ORF Transcript_13530/g.39179 Transcript_13530/m.39179 type:complete len:219 (-) Transcript_13530:419-1075(-)